MDFLGSTMDQNRYRRRYAEECSLKPNFVSDTENFPTYFESDNSSSLMAEAPYSTCIQRMPWFLTPALPDNRTHFLICSSEGLHLLQDKPKSPLWWKRLASNSEPLFQHMSSLLLSTSCLDKFGVSTPYSPVPPYIQTGMFFAVNENTSTKDIGSEVKPCDFNNLGVQKILKTETGTQTDSCHYCDFREEFVHETSDICTPIAAGDFCFPREETREMSTKAGNSCSVETSSFDDAEKDSFAGYFVPPPNHQLTINLTISSTQSGLGDTVGGDILHLTVNTPIGMTNEGVRSVELVISGTDAKVIETIIQNALAQSSTQSHSRDFVSKMAHVPAFHDYMLDMFMCDSTSQNRSKPPEGTSRENELNFGSMAKDAHCQTPVSVYSWTSNSHSDNKETLEQTSSGVILPKSESLGLRKNSEQERGESFTSYKSLVPANPRTYRFFSENIFKSGQNTSDDFNHLSISPFAAAGYDNQNQVPWSLVGTKVTFLTADDVEPVYDDDFKQTVVGRGSYGTVFLGSFVEDENQIVAIKKFHTKQEMSITLHEVKILLSLKDTGYVAYCFGVWPLPADPLNLCIVMEFFGQGKTVQKWIKETPNKLSPRRWVEICKQVFCGLKRIHQKHILINDIKSDNILLQVEDKGLPRIKFIDFGLASFRSGIRYDPQNISKHTCHFLAPEVCEGSRTSVASDIYSAGYLLEEICFSANLYCLKDIAYATTRTDPRKRLSIEQVIIMIERLTFINLDASDRSQETSSNVCPKNWKSERQNELMKPVWWSGKYINTVKQPDVRNKSVDIALPLMKMMANAGFSYRIENVKSSGDIQLGPSPFSLCGYEDKTDIPDSLADISVSVLDRNEIILAKSEGTSRITLGEGSFGFVYLAYMKEKQLAIKDFDRDHVTTDDIKIEAKIQKYLFNTGFVPKVFGFIYGDLGPGDLNIVQECVGNGCTLQRVLDSPPQHFTCKIWLEIATQLVHGMKLIHEKRVLINDVKSDNILLDLKENPICIKYIDFGLATYRMPYIFRNSQYLENCLYLAPEVRKGYNTSPLSDIYSLGYILGYIGYVAGIQGLSEIAYLCQKENPDQRPLISTVFNLIRGLQDEYEFLSPR